MERIAHIRKLFRELIPLFNALGDPVRQELYLLMMYNKPMSVGALTEKVQLSRPTVSFHLRILREAGIVENRKEGRNVYYTIKRSKYVEIMQELINEANEGGIGA